MFRKRTNFLTAFLDWTHIIQQREASLYAEAQKRIQNIEGRPLLDPEALERNAQLFMDETTRRRRGRALEAAVAAARLSDKFMEDGQGTSEHYADGVLSLEGHGAVNPQEWLLCDEFERVHGNAERAISEDPSSEAFTEFALKDEILLGKLREVYLAAKLRADGESLGVVYIPLDGDDPWTPLFTRLIEAGVARVLPNLQNSWRFTVRFVGFPSLDTMAQGEINKEGQPAEE